MFSPAGFRGSELRYAALGHEGQQHRSGSSVQVCCIATGTFPHAKEHDMLRGQIRVIAGLIGLALLFSTVLSAQLNRGIIEGTLTDPQGAVIPGVDVNITN